MSSIKTRSVRGGVNKKNGTDVEFVVVVVDGCLCTVTFMFHEVTTELGIIQYVISLISNSVYSTVFVKTSVSGWLTPSLTHLRILTYPGILKN